MVKKKKKIVLVNYGLANSFKDRIEINKELKNYPDLYNYVLDHELKHTDEAFSISDIKQEFSINKNVIKLLFFVLKRPKIWYEILPVYKKQNRMIHDLNMMILYVILIVLVIGNIIVFSKIF